MDTEAQKDELAGILRAGDFGSRDLRATALSESLCYTVSLSWLRYGGPTTTF